jgi:outer membrane receptor for ferrienterochelin and colicins
MGALNLRTGILCCSVFAVFTAAATKFTVIAGTDTVPAPVFRAVPKDNPAKPDFVEKLLNEVVVTGTLKEVRRMESPVPVEVYSPAFFRKNPGCSIFDGLQLVNGVRPQTNCNVCNTGDIRINGLPGAYTMMLIDGMPIVSSLSTVYGLSGIPNSLIERVEIVKGPASSLYGSEAIGGLINIITKKAAGAPAVSAELMSTSWGELNLDLGFKINAGKKVSFLTGINHFNFPNTIDKNGDGFTDMSLQKRWSVFQKWSFSRKENRPLNLAIRYLTEDRWGGQMNWNTSFRGGDSVYAESIYTNRVELIGNYQLPFREKMALGFSYNNHHQDSRYGTSSFIASQQVSFGQLTWDKTIIRHDLLAGIAVRYTLYNDNTPATSAADPTLMGTDPQHTWLPGFFIQDEITLAAKHKILIGARYDHHSAHGSIFTPRVAYKYAINEKNILRINAGTGFRVVNLFTEDHAALTGARKVVISETLRPEKSFNINLNLIHKIYTSSSSAINLDLTAFYTYFNNRITGDFESDPNMIIYKNLNGYAESKGVSANIDFSNNSRWKFNAGGTYMETSLIQNGVSTQQLLTEKFTGTWSVSYKVPGLHLDIDYTGNVYSPMRLPLSGLLDPRNAYSPWWSIQNIQLSFHKWHPVELFVGVKNILNYTPARRNPFLIARAHDPFDKQVQYDVTGAVMVNAANPYGLTFDPNYVYAPNQGTRFFAGLRLSIE